MFIESFNDVQKVVHAMAVQKGWYDKPRNIGELIALIHSELSECLEALRNGNPESDKIGPIRQAVEELADAVIRIMDMAGYLGWDVAGAIVEKIEYNAGRPYRHGKEF